MTLVVARKIENHISIVSDLALTTPSSSLQHRSGSYDYDPMKGMLKSIVVSPDTCICFAGTVDYALKAISQVKDHIGEWEIETVLEFLLNEHMRYDEPLRPDFIVATLNPLKSELHRIWKGTLEENRPNCWIGSYDAFKDFQREFDAMRDLISGMLGKDANFSEYHLLNVAMVLALRTIINTDKHKTVGGFVVGLSSNDAKNFKYATMSEVIINSRKQELKEGEWTTLQLGSIADGAYQATLLTPSEPGVAAIAIYIPQAKMGVVYYPLAEQENMCKNVTHQQFVDWLFHKHGFKLSGTIFH